jgi:hypothetical protein
MFETAVPVARDGRSSIVRTPLRRAARIFSAAALAATAVSFIVLSTLG